MRIDGEEESGTADVTVQMGPLIDCVFLLLIFFMCVALTKKSYRELQLSQRETSVAEETAEKPKILKITVTQKSGLYGVSDVDGQKNLKELMAIVERWSREEKDKTVFLETEAKATLSAVLPVLDVCKQRGLDVVYFRTLMAEDRSRDRM